MPISIKTIKGKVMKFVRAHAYTLSTLAFVITPNVLANGLSDLQQALAELNGQSPVSGVLTVSFSDTREDGDEQKLKTGAITSTLSESDQGLDIRYSSHVLSKIAQENRLKIDDEEVDTPTLNGAEILSASSLIPILSSAQVITDYVEQGTFNGERVIEYKGNHVRALDFSLPLESFIDDKKIRGYVDKFEGSYSVLINDDGVPVETRMQYSGKGSAYVFFSMKLNNEVTSQFTTNGKRLVRTKYEVMSNSSSTFNDRTYKGTWQLSLH